MIRIILPSQLCHLANVDREIALQVERPVTLSVVLDTIELHYPMLRGTLRDQITRQRRPFIRFFACGEDISQESPSIELPDDIATGKEPLRVVGAMAGG
jgi:sulfur-carrier protein